MDVVTYRELYRDFDALANLNHKKHDDLAVVEGELTIVSGDDFLQAPIRAIKYLVKGVYNPTTVIGYLEKLAVKTDAFVLNLQKVPAYLLQKDTWEFAKKVRRAATSLEMLSYSGRGYSHSNYQKFSSIFKKFAEMGDDLKKKVKLANPHRQSDKKVTDFDAPIDSRRIHYALPSYQTVEDTLKLARGVQKQMISAGKERASLIKWTFITAVVGLPLLVLTPLKWLLWDPIEFILNRKFVSRSPLSWYLEEVARGKNGIYQGKNALDLYANQLLNTPYITDAHVNAHCQLAQYEMGVWLACVSLDTTKHPVPSKASPLISVSNCCKILEAAGKSARCKQVMLPMYAERNEEIMAVLKRYKFKPDEENKGCYFR